MNHIKIIFSALLLFIFFALPGSEKTASAQPDAWKTWKQGCDIYERGESLMLAGKFEEALARFNESLKCFNKVKDGNPQWNRKMIDARVMLCTKKIDSISKYLSQPAGARQNTTAPVETGLTQTQTTTSDQIALTNLKKELDRTNAEIQKYKDKLFAAVVEVENAQREIEREKRRTEQALKSETQIEGLLKEKNDLEQNFLLLNTAYETLKKQKEAQTSSATDNTLQILAAEKQKYEKLAALCETLKKEAQEYKDRFNKAAAERTILTETGKRSESEIQQMKERLKVADDKYKEIEKAARKSTADLLGLDNEYKKIAASNKELSADIERLNADIKKLRSTPDADSIAAQLNLENDKLKNEKTTLQEKIEGLFKDKKSLSAELESKSTELSKTNNTLALIETARKSLKEQNEKLIANLKEKENSLAQALEKLNSIETASKEYEAKLKKLAGEYNELRSKSDARENAEQKEFTILHKKVQDLKSEIEKKNNDVKKAVSEKEDLDKTVKKLNDKVAELSKNADSSAGENSSLKKQLDALKSEIEKKNDDVKDAIKGKDSAEKSVAQLNAKVSELSERIKAFEKTGSQDSALKEEIEKLKEASSSKDNDIKKAASQKEELDKTLKKLNDKVAELSKNADSSAGENSSLKKQLETLKNEIEKKNDDIKNVVKGKDSAEKSVAQLNAKVSELSERIKAFEKTGSQDSALKEEIEKLKESISSKDNDIKKAVAAKGDAEKTVTELNQKIKELSLKHEAVVKKIIEENNSVKQSKTAIDTQKLNSEIAKLSAEKENAAAREKELASSLETAKKEIEKKNQEISEILKKVQKIKQDISTASQKDSKEKQELSTSLSDLKQMNAKLEKELAEAKTNMVSKSELQQKDKAMSALIEELRKARENSSSLRKQLEEMKKARPAEEKQSVKIQEEKQETIPSQKSPIGGDKLGVERTAAAPSLTKAANEKISFLIKAGLDAETQKDLKAAIWHYQKALQLEPDNPKALKNTARAAFKLKNYALAGESARQGLKKRDSDPELMRIYAISLFKTGDLDEASKVAEKLTAITKNQADDYLLFGEISFQLNKMPAAESAYKKSLELDPSCGKAAMGLARIYAVDKEKLSEGTKYYRKALELKEKADPGLDTIYPKDNAEKAKQGRLIIIRRNGETYFICDPYLYGVSNPASEPEKKAGPAKKTAAVPEKKNESSFDYTAVPKAEKAVLDSCTVELLLKAAEEAEKSSDWTSAAWNYKKAGLLPGAGADPLLKAAAVFRQKLKMHGKATEIYEYVLNVFPDEPHALSALGQIYYEQGKYPQALQLLNTAILIDPNNANIQRYQGLICLKLGNKTAAEQMLLKAYKTDSKNADIALDLARLYTLTFKTRLNDGAKWYNTAKMLGAKPDKVLEGFFPEDGTKKKAGRK